MYNLRVSIYFSLGKDLLSFEQFFISTTIKGMSCSPITLSSDGAESLERGSHSDCNKVYTS